MSPSFRKFPQPHSKRLLAAWVCALFLCGVSAGATDNEPENLPFQIDLSADLKAVNQLRISGGVVGRDRGLAEAGVLGGDDSAQVDTARASGLVEAFQAAHFEVTLALLDEVAAALRSRPDDAPADWKTPILSGNLAGGLHYARWPEAAMHFDALNNELNVASLEDQLGHFLGANASGEALGITLLVMPSAASNRRWSEEGNPIEYARGTAITYALGGHMHVPWCLYDGSQFSRFYGNLAAHQPIFQMIHENRDRFDGYVPALWEVLEVPYGKFGIEDVTLLETELRKSFDAGIPVVVRFRGTADGSLDVASKFGPDRFEGSPVSIRSLGQNAPRPTAAPFDLLDGFDGGFLPPIPRVSAKASNYPLVLHLVRGFGEHPAPNAAFTISGKWLPPENVRDISIASVAWEQDAPASLEWETTKEGDTLVRVADVPAWGVIRVETSVPVQLAGIERSEFRNQMAESEIPIMRMIRFSDRWKRPRWVDEALVSDTDPLDGYHIDRITWSYDAEGGELAHARERRWGFHGSIGLMHTHMGHERDLRESDMITRPPTWRGWARYPDGQAILIRPDWNPPRYGSSFATREYRDAVIERARQWIDLGVSGIQFDDVMGMLNRVWQYGGDFSDAMITFFKEKLIREGLFDVGADTSLEDLRRQIILEIGWENAARIVNAAPPGTAPTGWIAAPFQATSSSYPGEIWIASKPFARPEASFVVEYEVRFSGGESAQADLILADGERSTYLARFPLDSNDHPNVPMNQWIPIRTHYDPVSRTARQTIGDQETWSEPMEFIGSGVASEPTAFTAILMADPRICGVELRSLRIHESPRVENSTKRQ